MDVKDDGVLRPVADKLGVPTDMVCCEKYL